MAKKSLGVSLSPAMIERVEAVGKVGGGVGKEGAWARSQTIRVLLELGLESWALRYGEPVQAGAEEGR